MEGKDLFSIQAKQYQEFRPTYPPELFQFIYENTSAFDSALDCATGNGQAAVELAAKFVRVQAIDLSAKQLEHAVQRPNIRYHVGMAENLVFREEMFDLITVAQAIHWFDFDLFFAEVKRLAKPNATLAVWGYGLLRVNGAIDKLLDQFYTEVVGPFWNPERKHIDARLTSIPFPFKEIKTPSFELRVNWKLDELHGYISTWSAVRKFIEHNQYNPADRLIDQLRPLWSADQVPVTFPLFLRLGKIEK